MLNYHLSSSVWDILQSLQTFGLKHREEFIAWILEQESTIYVIPYNTNSDWEHSIATLDLKLSACCGTLTLNFALFPVTPKVNTLSICQQEINQNINTYTPSKWYSPAQEYLNNNNNIKTVWSRIECLSPTILASILNANQRELLLMCIIRWHLQTRSDNVYLILSLERW